VVLAEKGRRFGGVKCLGVELGGSDEGGVRRC
jgi:hypothetical protein